MFRLNLLNASAGLLTTLINIYTLKGGNWLIIALLIVIVIVLLVVTSLALAVFYKFWKIKILIEEYE